jgi:hypothetical protein
MASLSLDASASCWLAGTSEFRGKRFGRQGGTCAQGPAICVSTPCRSPLIPLLVMFAPPVTLPCRWEVVEAAAGAPSLTGASLPPNTTGPQVPNRHL